MLKEFQFPSHSQKARSQVCEEMCTFFLSADGSEVDIDYCAAWDNTRLLEGNKEETQSQSNKQKPMFIS